MSVTYQHFNKSLMNSRLSNIDLMILLYKADVAASKSAISDLKEAKAFLSEASRLDIDDMQLGLVHKKMEAVDKQIAVLKAETDSGKNSGSRTRTRTAGQNRSTDTRGTRTCTARKAPWLIALL